MRHASTYRIGSRNMGSGEREITCVGQGRAAIGLRTVIPT